mgnify:CR=1 FL=1
MKIITSILDLSQPDKKRLGRVAAYVSSLMADNQDPYRYDYLIRLIDMASSFGWKFNLPQMYAIFFHRVKYFSFNHNNFLFNYQFFIGYCEREKMNGLIIPNLIKGRVKQILLSIEKNIPLSEESKLVMDLVNSDLGFDLNDFIYFQSLLQTNYYGFLNNDEYNFIKGREFENILKRPNIFHTNIGKEVLEKEARENLNYFIKKFKPANPLIH